jgi:5-methylcytosine-specific restriction endonuclease McrA
MNTYPDNWPEIATKIKDAAGWECEHCGHDHSPETGHTLTVHHLDGDKANCTYENLVALCQRCHLHIQHVYFPGQQSFVQYEWAVKRGLM